MFIKELYLMQVKTIFVPTGTPFTSEVSAPLVATLPLEVIPWQSLISYFHYSLLFCRNSMFNFVLALGFYFLDFNTQFTSDQEETNMLLDFA